MSALLRALAPGTVVLVGTLAFLAWATDATVAHVTGTYGLAVYGAGLSLAWVFHRSRAFIALTVLAGVDIAFVGNGDSDLALTGIGTVVLGVLGVLGLQRDRGIMSAAGLLQGSVVGATVAFSGAAFSDPDRVARFAARPEIAPLQLLAWPGYPRATLVVVGFAVVAAAYGLYRYRGPIERAILWAVVLLAVAAHPATGLAGSELFVMATGMVITLGVVEASYVMAYQDDLTGLPGRRALMQYLDEISGPYALAMVDIDHFKGFNDRFGHDVGDQVLRLVATRLGRAPGGGKAYRYGGEEFTLLYPGRTSQEALAHVEAARSSIDATKFAVRSWKRPRAKPGADSKPHKVAKRKVLSVTVSAGIADSATVGSDPELVLKKADEALYRAKEGGRNRVAI
jgi:GGDEF domain-containing protein